MTGDVKVVEDGAEASPDSRSPQVPSWFWVAVGLVMGMSLAVVFLTGGSDDPVEPTESIATPDPDPPADQGPGTPPSTQTEPEGIGEVMAGFPDTLVGVIQLSGGSLAYLTWPVTGPPHIDPLPGFLTSAADFDASGRMLAFGSGVPDTDRLLLSLGTALRIQPLASDVTGFAWHDEDTGSLAYTKVDAGERQLWVVDTSREPEQVNGEVGVDGVVVAWGDWGYALQHDGSVDLLTPEGVPMTTVDGTVLDSGRDGWLLMSDPGLKRVSPGGGVDELDIDIGMLGDIMSAQVSPDATKLLVVGTLGYAIVPLEGQGEALYVSTRIGFAEPAWSSDSRFAISPTLRGVLIIDTETGGLAERWLSQHLFLAVAAVPLGGR